LIGAPRYLAWAVKHYGQVPFDLASSGIPTPALGELPPAGETLRVDDPEGPRRLRQAIATFNGVPSEETVPSLGTTHALWLAYASLVTPGDDVLVESPSYEPIWALAEVAGARVVRFERGAAPGYAVDVEAVVAALTPRTRVVALSSPHNPSGQRTDSHVLRLLAERLASQGIVLLVDEVYGPLGDMLPGSRVWSGCARRLGPNVVAVSSLTKSFGLGPGRIGWVLGPPALVARANEVLLATCGSLPLPHANYGAWAFTHIANLGQRAHDLTAGKREVVGRWMAERPDLVWSGPETGLFGFAVRNGPEDLLPVIEEGALREGVLVAAGTFFGVPNGFRVSWSIAREKLGPALELLGRVLSRQRC
jgi:aspartate/methionine/tyrosine aminotransferase